MANLFNKIYTGTLAQYSATNKDVNALYMVYDEATGVKSMYKGDKKVDGDFIIVNGAETTITPEKGVIYYISEFGKKEASEGHPYVGFYNGTDWVAMSDSADITRIKARLDILEGADTVEGSVKKTVKDAIDALDVTDTETKGSVVVAVSEEDGKVSTTKQALAVTTTDTTEGMQMTYDVTIGDHSVGKIDIPFCDAVLENAVLADMKATVDKKTGEVTAGEPKGADALVMVFKKGDGTYVGVNVDISKILVESEFKNGLAVSGNGEVSIKLVADNNYLKFGTPEEEGKNAPLEANVVTLADAKAAEGEAAAVTGLADALDVKTVIEENEKVTAAALNDLNTRIGKNDELQTKAKVIVEAINELKASGDVAVKTVKEKTAGQEVTVSTSADKTEVTIGVTKAAYTAATDDKKTNGAFTTEGLVDNTLLKQYVADEIAKNAVYWETL